MVALVLAAEGFRTSMLGANVPAGDLALMVAGHQPALLAVSASAASDPVTLASDLALVASAAAASKVKFIVGGAGFGGLPSLPRARTATSRWKSWCASRRASRDGAGTAGPSFPFGRSGLSLWIRSVRQETFADFRVDIIEIVGRSLRCTSPTG